MFQVKANMKLLKMGKYWVDLEWAKLLENWRFYTIAKEPLQSKVSSTYMRTGTSKYVVYCSDSIMKFYLCWQISKFNPSYFEN